MIFNSGDLRIRTMDFLRTGDMVPGHGHNFPHTTYCTRGGVLIKTLDKEKGVTAETILRANMPMNWHLIPAHIEHEITALPPEPHLTEAMILAARKAAPGVSDDAIKAIITASQMQDEFTQLACIYPFRNSNGEIVESFDAANPLDPYK